MTTPGAQDLTPLHWAAMANELAAVELLVVRGADVDAKIDVRAEIR
jgi:ankyrin repeat protein